MCEAESLCEIESERRAKSGEPGQREPAGMTASGEKMGPGPARSSRVTGDNEYLNTIDDTDGGDEVRALNSGSGTPSDRNQEPLNKEISED